ncbi:MULTISPECIES: hypothetical protein [Rhodovulum]|uniref:Uncharacterized protein n=2 Tax=Rhodovulum TaxID=34008 RepID=A0A8E2VPH4_9RHOB|nr:MULTISPECIES: hypothetical protein [Rhodovulum]PTW52057.1 hypothetical protein C8N38_101361 [Rhodovulum kholense]RAP43204.1 hypothetical protein BYZ73_00375 [Rhodovulum viride]
MTFWKHPGLGRDRSCAPPGGGRTREAGTGPLGRFRRLMKCRSDRVRKARQRRGMAKLGDHLRKDIGLLRVPELGGLPCRAPGLPAT